MHTRTRLSSFRLIGTLLVTLGCVSASSAQKGATTGPLHFNIQISQLRGVSLEVVDGFEWTTALDLAMTARAGGVGKTVYPTLTVRHKADGSNAVWNWYKSAAMLGNIDDTPGKVELVDSAGIVARSYTLPLLMPTRYRLINTPDGVVEELEIVVANPTGEVR